MLVALPLVNAVMTEAHAALSYRVPILSQSKSFSLTWICDCSSLDRLCVNSNTSKACAEDAGGVAAGQSRLVGRGTGGVPTQESHLGANFD